MEYVQDHCDLIPCKDLLQELQEYGVKNTDRCFIPSQVINSESGFTPISEIHPGDLVYTHLNRLRKVVNTQKRNFHGELIKIRALGNSEDIVCTPEHPFYMAKRQGPDGLVIAGWNWKYKNDLPVKEWVKAGRLQKGDYLFIPKRLNLPKTELSDFELYLLGWYLSDGYLSEKGQMRICFQGDQLEIAEKIRKELIDYDFLTNPVSKKPGDFKRKLPSIKEIVGF